MPSKTRVPKQPLRRSARLAAKAAAKEPKPVSINPYVRMYDYNERILTETGGRFSIYYWELYTEMFEYFYTNMYFFRYNMEYIQDTLRWAIEVTELALVTPQSGHTEFMRVVKDAIFRATIMLHSNGQSIP